MVWTKIYIKNLEKKREYRKFYKHRKFWCSEKGFNSIEKINKLRKNDEKLGIKRPIEKLPFLMINYNPKACKLFERLNHMLYLNLQHAENGERLKYFVII